MERERDSERNRETKGQRREIEGRERERESERGREGNRKSLNTNILHMFPYYDAF